MVVSNLNFVIIHSPWVELVATDAPFDKLRERGE